MLKHPKIVYINGHHKELYHRVYFILMLGDNRIEEVEAEYIPPRSQTGLTSGTDKEF